MGIVLLNRLTIHSGCDDIPADESSGEGNDVLLITQGPHFLLLAVLAGDALVLTADLIYRSSDPLAGVLSFLIRTAQHVERGAWDMRAEEDQTETPETDINEPEDIFALIEKSFKGFTNGLYH